MVEAIMALFELFYLNYFETMLEYTEKTVLSNQQKYLVSI